MGGSILSLEARPECLSSGLAAAAGWQRGEETYLFLLLIEVVNDDTDKQVEGEEGSEDDEDDKIDVHVDIALIVWLLVRLSKGREEGLKSVPGPSGG